MKTKINEIPLVGPKGRSELIKKINEINENVDKINETNENIDSKFKVLEEILGMDLNPNLDKKYYQYFTIEATQDDTNVYFRQSLMAEGENIDPLTVEISLDLGENWQTVTAGSGDDETPGVLIAELGEAEKLLIRGKNEAYGYYSENEGVVADNCNFCADKPCYVYGNIMSLVRGDDFARLREVKDFAFAYLFTDYNGDLDSSWVLSKEGEELLLPAMTLANECYGYMFCGCTGLTVAPELPATTLADYCYDNVFAGCTNLSYIKAMFTTTPGDLYTYDWVNNVKGTGTFVKNSKATWNVVGTDGIPTGWTVQTADK